MLEEHRSAKPDDWIALGLETAWIGRNEQDSWYYAAAWIADDLGYERRHICGKQIRRGIAQHFLR